uniref:Putative secreted protein n=1 Tax=Anopheles darlingi TaxID=43151 RepID=A0A2M4DA09_ANODA
MCATHFAAAFGGVTRSHAGDLEYYLNRSNRSAACDGSALFLFSTPDSFLSRSQAHQSRPSARLQISSDDALR